MGAPWSRIVNTTIKDYVKGAEVNVLRNRKLPALLKKKGRITYNHSGTSVNWRVQAKRYKMNPFGDGDGVDFSPKDRYKTAELDWRGYSLGDSMKKGEFLQNRNTEAIIKVYAQTAEMLMKDMEESWAEEFYINGSLPANAKRIYGIESFMAATQNAGNGAGTPTASFAGLSCVPGYYGGTWDSGSLPAWPNGRGDTLYDFWTPIVVDYGDTLFSSTNTWEANCEEAISFGLVKSQKSKSQSGQLDVIMTDDEMYRTYLKVHRAKERIIVEDGQLRKLGFQDVVNQDGTDVTWEYGIPADVGYGFNCDEMEVMSQQAQLFVPEGPDFDIGSKSWKFSLDFFGQIKWNPKFFVKFKKLT